MNGGDTVYKGYFISDNTLIEFTVFELSVVYAIIRGKKFC